MNGEYVKLSKEHYLSLWDLHNNRAQIFYFVLESYSLMTSNDFPLNRLNTKFYLNGNNWNFYFVLKAFVFIVLIEVHSLNLST